jgi:hypothetical protein
MSADIEHAGRPPALLGWQPSARAGWFLTAGLAVALIAALIWGISLVRRLDDDSSRTSPTESLTGQAQARRDVQLAVSSFAANFNNYSVQDIGAYKQRMLPLMTEEFAKSFRYAVDGIVTEVKATKMTSTGQVVQTAISSIDATHATALVVADVDITSALGDRQRHFRWKVSVVQAGDGWLVDDFQPVA